jgi:hypothetical protein
LGRSSVASQISHERHGSWPRPPSSFRALLVGLPCGRVNRLL